LAIARRGEHIDEGRRSALILLRRRPVLCLKNETGWSGTVPALALATASVGRRQNAAEPRVKPARSAPRTRLGENWPTLKP
jgi:hypothetical protein